MSELITPILQFGTSRFLQAHADLFFSQATPQRQITVVQSTGDLERAKRLAALSDPSGYPVRIRGIENGVVIDEEQRVTSVKRTLSTATEWDEVTRVAVHEAEVILSNTSDRGFDPQPDDTHPAPLQLMSYPAKLFHLLAARHAKGAAPLMIMPMELINENGTVLKARVIEIGRAIDAAPAGAIAEPYALWAIEAAQGVTAPCDHPAIQVVEDIEQIERLKLHILNLGHTYLAHIWQRDDLPPDTCVRQIMESAHGDELIALYTSEVLPGFAAIGMQQQATDYMTVTLDRFRNPFLDHKLADISQNHGQKIDRRIGAFLDWTNGSGVAMPRLSALSKRANT